MLLAADNCPLNQEWPMAKTAFVQTRVDPAIKQKAQHVLEKMNMSMSEAVSLYLHQIALQNKIPFPVRTPNALTAATMKDSEEGKELHHVASVDQLFEELDS